MKENNLVSLDDLLEDYSAILIDTCVLIAPLDYNQKDHTREELVNKIEGNLILREKISKALEENKGIYLTSKIVGEYITNISFDFKKKIKKLANSQFSKEDRKRRLAFLRFRNKTKNGRSNLINLFEEKQKILNLSEIEPRLFYEFKKKYSWVKEKYELSSQDFDLIFSAFVLERKKRNVALLSNDFNLAFAKKYITYKEHIPYSNIIVFKRPSEDLFKRIH